MNFRNNRLLMVGGSACTVLLVLAVLALVLVGFRLAKNRNKFQEKCRELARLNARQPFPSTENVERFHEYLEGLEFRVAELGAELSRDPFPAEFEEAAGFSAQVQEIIEQVKKQAELAGVEFAEYSELGFMQYASGGSIPEEEHLPRLSRQFYSVQRVVDVLIQAGVDSVDGLSRDMFEGGEQDAGRRRYPRRIAKEGEIARDDQYKEGLYYVEQIGVSFTASEDAVWRVLDLLVSAPHFMTVSRFSHTTQADVLGYDPEAARKGIDGEATRRYLSSGILSGENALSRPERVVAGREAIQVHLTIDVYSFEEADAL